MICCWITGRLRPTTDVYDHDSLQSGLLEAYGDSASDNGGWVNIDGVIDEYLGLEHRPTRGPPVLPQPDHPLL